MVVMDKRNFTIFEGVGGILYCNKPLCLGKLDGLYPFLYIKNLLNNANTKPIFDSNQSILLSMTLVKYECVSNNLIKNPANNELLKIYQF